MNNPSKNGEAQPKPPAAAAQPAAIDLDRLAEKVYLLMLADIRLEQARGVATPSRKERRNG